MLAYDPKEIEPKWQRVWAESGANEAKDDPKLKKYYFLVEFPYPSGDGLHVGHIRSYTALDILARKCHAEGYNVLYPIGWDAFGLPTENYAIKTGIHPAIVTKKNSDNFRRQLKSLGFSFDWSREINTSDPVYYKWTQWIFLQLWKHGLAYKAKMPINWCPKDAIGLANEEVIDGKCERCGTAVERREKEQWMLAITKYADRLDTDLDAVDYPERVKIQQRNWIGKSEGAEIDFELNFKKNLKDNERRSPDGKKAHIRIFTTRPDTLFGATYLVLAPEHLWVTLAIDDTHDVLLNKEEVKKYVENAAKKTGIARTAEGMEKTGVEIQGVKVINPSTKEEIPIFVADYVLSDYGTGAIMAVPAHDPCDFAFSQKYRLPVREVIVPERIDSGNPPREGYPDVERRVVHAIVQHPQTGKILLLRWKKFPWKTLIIGGVEQQDGDDIIGAAKREIFEETGFANVRYIRTLGGIVKARFFAAHKNENRLSYASALVFDLVDLTQVKISEEESAKHEIFWGTLDDVFPCAEIDLWKERYVSPTNVYTGEGVLIHSGQFDGVASKEARREITRAVGGEIVTKFKLRDWVFSRQRYWGEPIPLVFCENCQERAADESSHTTPHEARNVGEALNPGWIALLDEELPLQLPDVREFRPRDDGESPLASAKEWVQAKCPHCGSSARRETDTMPNWAGSSWYYMAYAMYSKLQSKILNFKSSDNLLKYWLPVDWYNGGMEHTTLHLLYSRFWHKFLFDIGAVPTTEPYIKRTSHGLILAEGGVKMSKSKGNVVNPDTIIQQFGADTLRLYEMFLGPFEQAVTWSEEALVGPRRFLERVWTLRESVLPDAVLDTETESKMHATIRKISEDIETMRFNTAVSALMIFANSLDSNTGVNITAYETLLRLLAPFAPHIAEELWQRLGHKTSIHTEKWPQGDESKIVLGPVKLAVQINGKVRGGIIVERNFSDEEIKIKALSLPVIQKWITGKTVTKVFVVKGRVINIVMEDLSSQA